MKRSKGAFIGDILTRLAHVYWEIELAFVWKAVRDRFPIERPALQSLLGASGVLFSAEPLRDA